MSQAGTFGASGAVKTLTGNSGGAVGPGPTGDIDIVGSGLITIVGTPGSNLLTISNAGGALADHAMVVGNAAGTIVSLAVGVTGQVIIGNTGADPTWSADAILSGNLVLPDTTNDPFGMIMMGGSAIGDRYFHNYGTNNIFVGLLSGNVTTTGSGGNSAFGWSPLNALTDGIDNTAIGKKALLLCTEGKRNTAIGTHALHAVTTGNYNTVLGSISLYNLITGSNNICISTSDNATGGHAGQAYTGAESHNILIGSAGVIADANTIRIGTQGSGTGEQDTTFVAGVYNTAVGATAGVVFADSTHQLGASSGAAGEIIIGGTKPSWLTAGTADYVLTAHGAAADPTWEINAAVGVDSLSGDSGGPLTGALTIAGGTNITTAAAGSDVTVNLDATITLTTVNATTFDTNIAAAAVTLAGTSLLADGTDTNISINITAKGTGTVIIDDLTLTTDLAVSEGGTGLSSLNDHSVLLGAAAANMNYVAVGATGTILVANTAADPTWLAAGTNTHVLTAKGAGVAPAWEAPTGDFTWSEVTGTTQAAVVDAGYITNNAALVTVTLPDTAALGSVLRITGKGAGGWKLAQNAGETVYFGTSSTTPGAGGSLASTAVRDTVELVCVTADTDWNVISSVGNITVV